MTINNKQTNKQKWYVNRYVDKYLNKWEQKQTIYHMNKQIQDRDRQMNKRTPEQIKNIKMDKQIGK